MVKEYQVTLFCGNGKYKPVSAIVKKDTSLITNLGREAFIKEIQLDGIRKICMQRYWNTRDLRKYNYNQVKIREYDKSKIEYEKRERGSRAKRAGGQTHGKQEQG